MNAIARPPRMHHGPTTARPVQGPEPAAQGQPLAALAALAALVRLPGVTGLIKGLVVALMAALTMTAPGGPVAADTPSAQSSAQSSTQSSTQSFTGGAVQPVSAAPTLPTVPVASVAVPKVKAADDCLGPDIRCEVQDGAKAAAKVGAALTGNPAAGGAAVDVAIDQVANPFTELGDQVASAAADAWTAAMLALWSAGLFVLKLVLGFADQFLTPDLSADGPGRDVYAYTFWIAAALVLVMTMVQLGAAAIRREGKGLARVAIGGAQFVIVWAVLLGYCVVVVTACSELSRALMEALLGVNTWSKWEPLSGIDAGDITDGVMATVLGLLGLVLWLAALGHLLIMLARAASLIVLVATAPISAAGLVADAGKAWFWKSLRWFHAAAFTPVVMVLVLGLGVQLSTGVAAGLSDSTSQAIGTALPSVMLICVACVAPLALFKMLAFVDPGTPSGASFRQGMAMQGGIQGLLGGDTTSSGGSSGGSAASSADANGRSAGESGAEGSTNDRFSKSTQGALSSFGGPVGGTLAGGLAKGMGMVQKIGTQSASLMSDEANQTGVGHHTYGPDFSNIRSFRSGGPSSGTPGAGRPYDDDGDGGEGGGDAGQDGAGGSGGDGAEDRPRQSAQPGGAGSNPAAQGTPQPPMPASTPPVPAAQASGPSGTAQSNDKPGAGGKPAAGGGGGAAAEGAVVPV